MKRNGDYTPSGNTLKLSKESVSSYSTEYSHFSRKADLVKGKQFIWIHRLWKMCLTHQMKLKGKGRPFTLRDFSRMPANFIHYMH